MSGIERDLRQDREEQSELSRLRAENKALRETLGQLAWAIKDYCEYAGEDFEGALSKSLEDQGLDYSTEFVTLLLAVKNARAHLAQSGSPGAGVKREI